MAGPSPKSLAEQSGADREGFGPQADPAPEPKKAESGPARESLDLWPVASRELTADHELLCRVVRQAGALASEFFHARPAGWDKRPGEPVSEADLAVDSFIRRALLAERPDYGWLSEESEQAGKWAEMRFVVDPIDGTRSFLKGRPEYAVAAAVVTRGRPLVAAVFNPETREFFEAVTGAGARLNGRAIAVRRTPPEEGARLLVSWREFQRLGEAGGLVGCRISPIGSIAYKTCLVAAGTADGVVALSPKSDWDLAAADLILSEAGGRITDGAGSPLVYKCGTHKSVVAASPALHRKLIAKIGQL